MRKKFFYIFFIVLSFLCSCKNRESGEINKKAKQEIVQSIPSESKKTDSVQLGLQNEDVSSDKDKQIIPKESVTPKYPIENGSKENSVNIPVIFYILPFFIILLIVGILFFLFRMKEKVKSLRREVNDIRRHIRFPKNDISNKQIEELKEKINTLEKSIIILEEQKDSSEKAVIYNFETKSNISQEEKKTYRGSDVLHAERKKNTSDGLDFTKKSTQNTLYKLKGIGKNKFSFEIFTNLSEFTLKKIVNRPEELDNECFNLNSNQEFKSKITTVKKGILIMENEKYKVEEKAEIKFE